MIIVKQVETKHEIIENYYINLIESNKVSAGEQLPSENEIASLFNVSRHTVRQALNYLSQEGWIYKERGKGSFFSNRKEKEKKRNVAVLTTYISDYIFPRIISGIEEEFRKKGYNLLLFSSNNDMENEKSCLESIDKLKQNNIKYIEINANCDEEESAYIIVDDEQGGYKLTHYLLELGHRNIAALLKVDDLQGERRRKGYINALDEYNIKFNKSIVGEYITDNRDMYVDQFVRNILKLENRPTAIVCYNDQIALRVINNLRKEGITVPQDISIVSFDDSSLAVSSDVKLTTIKHPKKDMGRQAAKCIIDMIEGRIEKPQYIYPAELIVRDSCKRL